MILFLKDFEKIKIKVSTLWVTKDWRLLHQAALDLVRRHNLNPQTQIARLGGKGTLLHPLQERRRVGMVVYYSTLQSVVNCLKKFTDQNRPTLVVYDEFHWGAEAKIGKILRNWCQKHQIPIVGLTATPRNPVRTNTHIAYSKTFAALITEEVLAAPKLETVGTGHNWSPQMGSGDVSSTSLKELADDPKRNEIIINRYTGNARRYGKTLVFACNIAHANQLGDLFKKAGIAVRVVHSQMTKTQQQESVQLFRSGAVQVLVNVSQITHGVDIPDIQTLLMCRPTASDILFSQMIGRGCRRCRLPNGSTKEFFYLVEFTDNLQRHDIQLITSQTYFEGSTLGDDAAILRHPGDGGIAFDPTGTITWIPDDAPEPIRGLCYRHNQSFGIEFEFTHDDFDPDVEIFDSDDDMFDSDKSAWWFDIAEQLRKSLAEKLPVADEWEGEDEKVWNVKFDRSCGWEVTSRVLRNREGFDEVVTACEALKKSVSK